jgi:hypothetical protein
MTSLKSFIDKRLKKEYYQLYGSKIDNLDERDKFLEGHKLPKLTQEETLILLHKFFQKTVSYKVLSSNQTPVPQKKKKKKSRKL